MLRTRSEPGKTNPLMAKSVISGTGQYFSSEVSKTTSKLEIRKKSRTGGPPVRYSRYHDHESV